MSFSIESQTEVTRADNMAHLGRCTHKAGRVSHPGNVPRSQSKMYTDPPNFLGPVSLSLKAKRSYPLVLSIVKGPMRISKLRKLGREFRGKRYPRNQPGKLTRMSSMLKIRNQEL